MEERKACLIEERKACFRMEGQGRRRAKRWLSAIAVLSLFAGGWLYCGKLLVNKQSRQKYELFFSADQEFDVLFLGSSHVINGVSPLDLFRGYGIASYNLSMHGNYVGSGYYLLKEVLERMKREGRRLPQMAVLDVYGDTEGIGNLHNAWDSFPLSRTKWEMAKRLVGDQERMGMMVPFSLYHNRWGEVGKNDFEPSLNLHYGVELRYGMEYPAGEIVTDARDSKEMAERNRVYLDQMREMCEAYGVSLVLIHIPYSYFPDLQREANSYYAYAKEYGILYVNYMNEETGIDFDIDFFDAGHLNPVGMRRMTEELGELLSRHGARDRRQEEGAREWERAYEEFIRYRIERLKGLNQVKLYLMALNDPDLVSEVQIRREMLADVQIAKLVDRLKEKGDSVLIVDGPEAVLGTGGAEGKDDLFCMVYRRGRERELVEQAGFVCEESWKRRQ